MSVAFRRDGDEEHLEPKFEIPIPPGPNLVTARGLQQIAGRIAELELRIAGLSGADEETQLKAAQRELRYWQTRQVTAELVPVPSGQAVAIGTSVTFTLNGKERSLTIVGDDEADPANGLVSFSSPLARALMRPSQRQVSVCRFMQCRLIMPSRFRSDSLIWMHSSVVTRWLRRPEP